MPSSSQVFRVWKQTYLEVIVELTLYNLSMKITMGLLLLLVLLLFPSLALSLLNKDVDILTFKNPFGFLTRDSDVEGMSDGWDPPTAYGYDDVLDDQEMGWSRYAHSIRIFVFNSGLFYIRPTQASMDLIDKIIHRVETENGWDQAIFNECIFFPSHPGYKVCSALLLSRQEVDCERNTSFHSENHQTTTSDRRRYNHF